MTVSDIVLEVEALIFAANQPIKIDSIGEIIGSVHETIIEPQLIINCIEFIQEKYNSEHYPFELVKSGGGYQFLTKNEYHSIIAHLNGDKYNKKLSATAMETLAIIAYKQPITKSEIEYIRGVSSDYAVHKLLEKELIIIAGRDEEVIGKPLLYCTSEDFLNYLGINDYKELPQLKDIETLSDVVPTDATEAVPDAERNITSNLFVDENGALREIKTDSDI